MKIKFLIISLFICSVVAAQDFVMKEKLADRYYSRFDYYRAIAMYEEILKKSPGDYKVYEKLADSYRKINDSENAERCYAVLTDSLGVKNEYLLYYAQALARNGKYENAAAWYQKYGAKEADDKRGSEYPVVYRDMAMLYKDSASFTVKRMPFSSETSDFSPAYFGNEIVFASARKSFSLVRSLYNRTNTSFLDLFIVSPDSSGSLPFSEELNSIYHEGPVTFSRNLDTIIFTRSNFYNRRFRKSSEGINKLKLFQADWDKKLNLWVNISQLPFNSDQYSVGHPTLSADGKSIYFASDMPGGFGETDIYVSHQITDSFNKSTWGKPVNLGDNINTRGSEMFPYIDNDGSLWFASNGLPGLGGLDIFVAGKEQEMFKKPLNPGFPLNTRFDDFGFITRNSGNDGYLSSDRFNAIGDDDIFRLRRLSRKIIVMVFDSESKKALSSANIIVSAEGSETEKIVSDAGGSGEFAVTSLKPYNFEASKELYQECKVEISQGEIDKTDTLKFAMVKRIPAFQLTAKIYSATNLNPVPGAIASLINKADISENQTTSDENGMFSFELQPETDYIIKVSVASPGSQCGSVIIERSTRGNLSTVSFNESFPVFCVGDVIKVENIYYDLGKFNIRPDAAKELDKVLKIMKESPGMKIELRSHTDSRGSASSNMTLSEKRAASAAEYLFSGGIARDRVSGKGFGETLPLNHCVKGVKCSEDEFKVNRRTEFKILSIE
jgi:outer membrane protein OmpA-like peptidoglycan-associated protein/tetratricopeptide (TPR) repeat protein